MGIFGVNKINFLINFNMTKNTSFLSSFLNVGWCCSCKVKEDEFTLNIEREKCEEEDFRRSNDSYDDNILILDTIIKINENI